MVYNRSPMAAENRLPRGMIWTVIAVCALPTLAHLGGLDLGSPSVDGHLGASADVDGLHRHLAGSFVHTLLEWSAFLAALVTVLLAFTHFAIVRDVATPILGTALVCAGAMDAFHILAADRLIASVADSRQFIPLTWGISRVFNVSITLLGTLVLLWRGRLSVASQERVTLGFLAATGTGFALLAYGVIHLCASSQQLPETLYPEALVTRPFDVVPLILYLLAGLFVYPRVYRRHPSLFTHALILSVVPDIAVQLHMALGSEALYDHHFNVAHALKVVAYTVPLLGLLLDYTRTYRGAERARDQLARSRDELEARVRERTAELATAKETAVAANRAKSDFLTHMSHELRTPLNSILGYAQILRRDPVLGARQRSGVEVIERSGDHLLALINEVLDLSKIEAGKLELEPAEVALPALLESLADSERVRAEQKGLSFSYVAETPLPTWVRGDERRLRQILLNLVGNAIKFTTRGGVTLRVARLADRAETMIRFVVEDTGPGIDPEALREIFLPFRQVGEQDQADGTGLGLAITCRLVQLMGGEIEVDSVPGEGSTFGVILHLGEIDRPDDADAAAAPPVIAYRGSRRRILVVDDKAENRAVISGLLAPLGFDIAEASNGREALESVRVLRPDLVLMDLVMPLMDGFEATRRLRGDEGETAGNRLVIIALSASVFDHNRQQSRMAGCDDFLPKPVRMPILLDRLAHHLGLEWVYASEKRSVGRAASTEGSAGSREGGDLSPEERRALLELARRGDIQGITRQLDTLEASHGAAAVAELRRLAGHYDMKAIRTYLEDGGEEAGGEDPRIETTESETEASS